MLKKFVCSYDLRFFPFYIFWARILSVPHA